MDSTENKTNLKNKKKLIIVVAIAIIIVLVFLSYFFWAIKYHSSSPLESYDIEEHFGEDCFNEDSINNVFGIADSKILICPPERVIEIEKGDSGGFAYSIENQDLEGGSFTYNIDVAEVEDKCELSIEQADNLIRLGKTHGEVPIELESNDKIEPPKLVSFRIPDTAPICAINYRMNVEKDGSSYTGVDVRLEILEKKSRLEKTLERVVDISQKPLEIVKNVLGTFGFGNDKVNEI